MYITFDWTRNELDFFELNANGDAVHKEWPAII